MLFRSDAIFVHDDGSRVVIIELARTDDLVEGYWRERSAAKDEKYRPLREAIAAATGAVVVQATLVIGFRGGLCESEWRSQLAPLDLSPSAFLELRRLAVRSTVQAASTIWRIRNQARGELQMAAGALLRPRASSAPPGPVPANAVPSAPAHPAARPAGGSTGARAPCQARLPLLLARAAAQAHVSDAHLMRTVARAAPPSVVRLARILRRRLLRGVREPRIGGLRLNRSDTQGAVAGLPPAPSRALGAAGVSPAPRRAMAGILLAPGLSAATLRLAPPRVVADPLPAPRAPCRTPPCSSSGRDLTPVGQGYVREAAGNRTSSGALPPADAAGAAPARPKRPRPRSPPPIGPTRGAGGPLAHPPRLALWARRQ